MKIALNPLNLFRDSLYVTNPDAGEGDSEAQEVDPNEIIVWNRPGEFMGGEFAMNKDNMWFLLGRLRTIFKSPHENKYIIVFFCIAPNTMS